MHWARVVGGCLFGLAVVTFLSFAAGALILGGDALNGKVEGDRHFLGSHGNYTEVSEGVYRYSRAHGIGLIVIFPLGLVVGGLLMSYANRVEKRRLASRLGERESLTARQFGERFFGPDPQRIELAAALRDILEKEVDTPLAGLRPDDRLEDISRGAIPGEPFVFMEIEERLGIDTAVTDFARFEPAVRNVHTFQDLVDYVARCSKKEPRAPEPPAPEVPRNRLVIGLERIMGIVFGRGLFVLFALLLVAAVLNAFGLTIVAGVVAGVSVSCLGLAITAAGLWVWMLALAAFRLRRQEQEPIAAWFGLFVWGAAGTFVTWCGIGTIVAFFYYGLQ